MNPSCDLLGVYRLMGQKWFCPLLYTFGQQEISYNQIYRQLKRQINPTLLSNTLREMEQFKFVTRSENGRRVHYQLTEQGVKLKDIVTQIKDLSLSTGMQVPAECDFGKCTDCANFN